MTPDWLCGHWTDMLTFLSSTNSTWNYQWSSQRNEFVRTGSSRWFRFISGGCLSLPYDGCFLRRFHSRDKIAQEFEPKIDWKHISIVMKHKVDAIQRSAGRRLPGRWPDGGRKSTIARCTRRRADPAYALIPELT